MAGILHAGGVLNDALLQNQNAHTMRSVFAPKVQGTSHMLALAGRQPTNVVKLFSSVASSLGSGGQANYAAANAVMDQQAVQSQNQVCLKISSPSLTVRQNPPSKIKTL